MFGKLLPREDRFFGLFNEQAAIIRKGIELFSKGLAADGGTAEWTAAVKSVENEADAVAHRIFTTLNHTFVTPFDREDIQLLALRMDDVIDLVEKAAARMAIYALTTPPPTAAEMTDVLSRAFAHVAEAVDLLSSFRNRERIFQHCIEINRLENRCDQMLRGALQTLFADPSDALYVIKAKDVYESLEEAVDRCEDLANIIETIVIKNA